ncbi:MAG: hypothetical protein WAV05_09355 [Anaerolineales bacterium]
MDTFAQAIDGWHDFYILIGTASATLVGLLFVSLSLNANVIARKTNADLRALAEQTFASFLFVLLFATFFLIPHQGQLGLGLPLLGVGGLGLGSTISHFFKTHHTHPRLWRRPNITSRFIIPILCYLVLITIAVSILFKQTGGLYWLVPVMILLLIFASLNAWDLLLKLREPRKET